MRRRALAALLTLLVWRSAVAQVEVLTYHNDNSRTGQNTHETVLTPANVNPARFGKLFSRSVDGDIYAQPLYVHGVVLVATEADSLYALDANNGAVLWHLTLGASPVDARADLACAAIAPQVGITATPVIDPVRRTIYVEARLWSVRALTSPRPYPGPPFD